MHTDVKLDNFLFLRSLHGMHFWLSDFDTMKPIEEKTK